MKVLQLFSRIKVWLFKLSLTKKIITVIIILGISWFGFRFFTKGQQQVQYQAAKAEKGTVVVSVTGSGNVSASNSTSVSTQATGVISKVYVNDGDQVKTGDKVAEIDLDLQGKQRSSQSLASYQGAKNTLESAKADLYTTQSTMFGKWRTFMDIAQNSTYQNSDGTPNNFNRALPEFHIAQDDWLATEAKYKNQQNVINQAQTALNSAWLSYQQSSPTVYAPISGTVSGLSLQVGSVISSQTESSSTSSTSSASSQKVANIITNAPPTITVNLTEVDAPKVKVDNKVTITLDAFSGKTYTGSVISVDTVGAVSSGVTSYPVVIKFDTELPDILANMSATANIITQTKDNALLVPTSAVQTQNGQSSVRVLKNGQVSQVQVETGLSSTTQIEITSGLSEGDTVITGSTSSTGTNQQNGQTQSPFGGFGGGRFGR